MSESKLNIRRAESPGDYVALQEAQRLAWGLADDSYVVPVATMVGAQHHGGLVLGAFTEEGRAVGLSFAFLGRVGGRWCLYSQLTGVVPGAQGQGLGARMKELQREHARSLGLEFIAWAFDPLQAGNAHFNLHRLGASASRYIPNMYGMRTDALNAGVPTDRLIAEWPVEPGPPRAPDVAGTLSLPRIVEGPDEPRVVEFSSVRGSPELLIEIPAQIATIRAEDPALAERWRTALALAFGSAFGAGYQALDVVRDSARSFYVLRSTGEVSRSHIGP
jgi:predicted GNAT superfamily acetyltransferase